MATNCSSLRQHYFTKFLEKNHVKDGGEVIISELTYYKIIVAFAELFVQVLEKIHVVNPCQKPEPFYLGLCRSRRWPGHAHN